MSEINKKRNIYNGYYMIHKKIINEILLFSLFLIFPSWYVLLYLSLSFL